MYGGRFTLFAVSLALGTTSLLPATVAAQQPFGPYDGSNPFRCKLQDVGMGTDFPRPAADPFCVKFDKTAQNVTDFGLLDFLANEPARVAAAVPKCFYYQRDHWTGSVVQGEQPELWNWVGSYFFDKARGVGGVHVRDFRVGGEPFDATPHAPPEFMPYLEEGGGGGVQLLFEWDPDPSCVELVDTPKERQEIYRSEPRERDCVMPGGPLRGRQAGRARLGLERAALRRRLGPPKRSRSGTDRWCVVGDASLRAVYREGRVALLRSSARGHALRGVARGDRAAKAKRRFGSARFTAAGTRVIPAGATPARRAFVGIAGGRVRWVAIADPALLEHRAERRRAINDTR